jgi:hypothetical protein
VLSFRVQAASPSVSHRPYRRTLTSTVRHSAGPVT